MSIGKGKIAENIACCFLEKLKYKIIQKNFYANKLGEIDIIALKDNTYYFFEVKSSNDYETAISNITKTKLSKIKKSVNFYIQKNKIELKFCICAIIIADNKIDIIENITM